MAPSRTIIGARQEVGHGDRRGRPGQVDRRFVAVLGVLAVASAADRVGVGVQPATGHVEHPIVGDSGAGIQRELVAQVVRQRGDADFDDQQCGGERLVGVVVERPGDDGQIGQRVARPARRRSGRATSTTAWASWASGPTRAPS